MADRIVEAIRIPMIANGHHLAVAGSVVAVGAQPLIPGALADVPTKPSTRPSTQEIRSALKPDPGWRRNVSRGRLHAAADVRLAIRRGRHDPHR